MPVKFLDNVEKDVSPQPTNRIRFVDEEPDFKRVTVRKRSIDVSMPTYSSDNPIGERVFRVSSPEQQAVWEKEGKINWWEYAWDTKAKDIYYGDVADIISLTTLTGRLKKNEYTDEGLRRKDEQKLNDWMLRQEEIETRGLSWGTQMYRITAQIPTFAAEMWLTGPLASSARKGFTLAGRKTISVFARKATMKFAKKAAKRRVVGLAEKAATVLAREAVVGAARTTVMPHRYLSRYAERRLNDVFSITEKGINILHEAKEKPVTSFVKGYGDAFVEYYTETLGGELLKPAGKIIGKGILSRMPKAIQAKFKVLADAIRKITPKGKATELFTKGGFNGIIEEYGEERLGALLRIPLGLDERDKPTLSKLQEAVFPGWEQSLIEIGAFSIWGGVSIASQKTLDFYKASGKTEQEAQKIVENLTQTEKEEIVDMIEDKEGMVDKLTPEQIAEIETKTEFFPIEISERAPEVKQPETAKYKYTPLTLKDFRPNKGEVGDKEFPIEATDTEIEAGVDKEIISGLANAKPEIYNETKLHITISSTSRTSELQKELKKKGKATAKDSKHVDDIAGASDIVFRNDAGKVVNWNDIPIETQNKITAILKSKGLDYTSYSDDEHLHIEAKFDVGKMDVKSIAKDLIEYKNTEEIQDKLQKIFGTYEELDKIEAEELPPSHIAVLADEYMADLEHSVTERDYEETESILIDLKRRFIKRLKKAKPENIGEIKEAIKPDKTGISKVDKLIAEIKDRTEKLAFARDMLKQGNPIVDFLKDRVKRFAEGREKEELDVNFPKGFFVKEGITPDEAVAEINKANLGAQFENFQELGQYLKNWAEQKTKLKQGIAELTGPAVKRREITVLKMKVRDIQRGIREGEIKTHKDVKDVQTELIEIIEQSGLEAKDRDKFRRAVKNIQTEKQLREAEPKLLARIEDLVGKAQARKAKVALKKALKTIKPKKQAGKLVGKYTAEFQSALNLITRIVEMDEGEAQDIILRNIEATKGLVPDADIQLQNELITVFTGFDNKSTEDLNKAIEVIKILKEGGKEAREVLKIERKERIESLRNIVIDQITGGIGIKPGRQTTGARKTLKEKIKGVFKGLGAKYVFSLNGILETLEFNAGVMNRKLVKEFGVLEQENEYKSLEAEFIEDFNNIIAEAYGIKNKNLTLREKIDTALKIQARLTELTQEINLGTFKNSLGQDVELIFTKDELIKKYIELKDPTLITSFLKGNNYTHEIIKAIFSKLTPQDRAFGLKQVEMYREQWKKINPIYREFFGVNLPFNEFYSPIAREGFLPDLGKSFAQLSEDFAHRIAVSTGSLKQRIKNILPIKTQGSVAVLDRHFKETNYFVAWAEKMRDLERVFKDTQVKEAINEVFSPNVYKALTNTLDDIASKGNRSARNYKVVDFFRRNFTLGKLMLKPALTVKQFVSVLAYLEKVNPASFIAGSADFWLNNPLENFRTLQKESIFIKTRGSANMERDISAATKSTAYKQFSTLQNYKNLATLNIKLGDKGAIVWGSWIMRRDRLQKNIPIADIIKEYEEFSSDTQQSADISRLSEVQRGGSFERLFTMFKSSQRQYFAKEVNAVKSLFQKDGTSPKNIARVARILAIYHVLLPTMFQFVANFGGWEERDLKEYLRAAILGSLNGLFLFGDIIDSIIRTALKLRAWPNEVPVATIGKALEDAIRKVDFEDITIEDLGDATKELTEAGDSFAVPASYLKNIGQGVSDIIEGDIRKGVGEVLGWSEGVLKQRGGKVHKFQK